jgi:hypothetical protein
VNVPVAIAVDAPPRQLRVVPLSLKEANAFVALHHRHHKPVVGHKFSLAAKDEITGDTLGAVIVGRPVARMIDHQTICEVTRLVTDGSRNVCSFLYSAAARVAKEMGYEKIQTYILETEPGTSLKATGWVYEATTSGGAWHGTLNSGNQRRQDQPTCPKQRWSRRLRS